MTEMIKLIESDSPSLKVNLGPCSEDLNRMELKMKLLQKFRKKHVAMQNIIIVPFLEMKLV